MLHVANEEAGVALGEVVEQQTFDVIPLQAGRILKLVDQDMAQLCPRPLEYERRILLADHLVEEQFCFGEQKAAVGFVNEVKCGGYGVEEEELIQVFENQPAT